MKINSKTTHRESQGKREIRFTIWDLHPPKKRRVKVTI